MALSGRFVKTRLRNLYGRYTCGYTQRYTVAQGRLRGTSSGAPEAHRLRRQTRPMTLEDACDRPAVGPRPRSVLEGTSRLQKAGSAGRYWTSSCCGRWSLLTWRRSSTPSYAAWRGKGRSKTPARSRSVARGTCRSHSPKVESRASQLRPRAVNGVLPSSNGIFPQHVPPNGTP